MKDIVGSTFNVSPGCIHTTIPGPNYSRHFKFKCVYEIVLDHSITLFLIVKADEDELNSYVGFLCVTASRLILAVKTCMM